MNIHLRAIGRMIKTLTIPLIAGVVIAIVFAYFPMQHILLAVVFGLVMFMFWMFYKWTLEQIITEEDIKKAQQEHKDKNG